jgi:flagellar basal-body rod protein FlgF
VHRGLYAAASAMLVQERMGDVVANNLANVNTAGFKGRIAVNKSFPDVFMDRLEKLDPGEGKIEVVPPDSVVFRGRVPIGDIPLANVLSETAMKTEAGMLQITGKNLDVALQGDGFFVVQDLGGNIFYTRSGHFQLDSEGRIVTHDGMLVLGNGGPLEIGDATRIEFDNSGRLIADDEVVDTLQVVSFQSPSYLRQIGGSLLSETRESGQPDAVEDFELQSGALEMSNVNVVEEMVRMIEAHRAYESASKAVSTHDEMTGRLITTFGRAV